MNRKNDMEVRNTENKVSVSQKFVDMFKMDLPCRVAVYVPSTIEVDKPTDSDEIVQRTLSDLSILFGGATATQALGGWVNEKKTTTVEKIHIVYSFCTKKQLRNNIEKVLAICERIKIEMSQEAVALEINRQIKFI